MIFIYIEKHVLLMKPCCFDIWAPICTILEYAYHEYNTVYRTVMNLYQISAHICQNKEIIKLEVNRPYVGNMAGSEMSLL